MNPGLITTFLYAILAIVGGIIGYVQARSQMSLISGIASGVILLIAGILQLQGQFLGVILAALVTLALVIVFAVRLKKTGKFMPAGLMLAVGALTLVCLLPQLF